MSEQKKMTVEVMRYLPEKDDKPRLEKYEVPYDETTSILDALAYIKDYEAPDLAYRSSCRMAICGSCGVMVNNRPKLGCKTFLRDYQRNTLPVRIEAMANFTIERDLVVDITPLLNGIDAVKPYIIGNKKQPEEGVNRQTPAQLLKYQQFSMCINCGLCYAACPQFGLNPQFIGPAAIALAHRYNLDDRDCGQHERMAQLNTENGVWPCTFIGYCSAVCPKNVDPAAAIQQEKVESSKDITFSLLKLAKKKKEADHDQ